MAGETRNLEASRKDNRVRVAGAAKALAKRCFAILDNEVLEKASLDMDKVYNVIVSGFTSTLLKKVMDRLFDSSDPFLEDKQAKRFLWWLLSELKVDPESVELKEAVAQAALGDLAAGTTTTSSVKAAPKPLSSAKASKRTYRIVMLLHEYQLYPV